MRRSQNAGEGSELTGEAAEEEGGQGSDTEEDEDGQGQGKEREEYGKGQGDKQAGAGEEEKGLPRKGRAAGAVPHAVNEDGGGVGNSPG